MKGFVRATTVAIMCLLLLSTFASPAQATYDPRRYVPSLHFDGLDDSWDERVFPVQGSGDDWSYHIRLINDVYDYNLDHLLNPEDSSENILEYKIRSAVNGISREGKVIHSTTPNDQSPAVYWNRAVRSDGWVVYEYWYYYALNETFYYYLFDHEHDWEKYYIYFWGGDPKYVRLSSHHTFPYVPWGDLTALGIFEDGRHLKLNLEGGGGVGSHAFQVPSNSTFEDGVRIKWSGYINKRGGRLDSGHDSTQRWYLFAMDPDALERDPYTQAPANYYYSDPQILPLSSEYGDSRPAPWNRTDWAYPPGPTQPWSL